MTRIVGRDLSEIVDDQEEAFDVETLPRLKKTHLRILAESLNVCVPQILDTSGVELDIDLKRRVIMTRMGDAEWAPLLEAIAEAEDG